MKRNKPQIKIHCHRHEKNKVRTFTAFVWRQKIKWELKTISQH